MLETRVVMTLFAENLAKRKCYKDEIRQKRPELSYILGTVPYIFPAHEITQAGDKNGNNLILCWKSWAGLACFKARPV